MGRCFCGCERKAPLRRLRTNSRGAALEFELRLARRLFEHGMVSPNAEVLLRDGDALLDELAGAVHEDRPPAPGAERRATELRDRARERFGPKTFGTALKRSKLKHEQAMDLLAVGNWDPFADRHDPVRISVPDAPPATLRAATPTLAPPERSSADWAGDLERLARLHAEGALTDEEFAQAKRKLLDA